MLKFAVVYKNSKFGIGAMYEALEVNWGLYGGPLGDPACVEHLVIDPSLDSSCLKAQDNGQGGISLVIDNEKLNAKRAKKLNALRSARESKFAEVDVMINDIVLGDTTLTAQQIKDYRKKLRDITEQYKTNAALLDTLDINIVAWPVKPS